jgi:hypothetical protein
METVGGKGKTSLWRASQWVRFIFWRFSAGNDWEVLVIEDWSFVI